MSCDHNCSNCSGCGGSNGCAASLYLTEEELSLLNRLAQIPFLPVARAVDGEIPVYLEEDTYSPETYSAILRHLEAKGLIDLDYCQPLKGFSYADYRDYPVHGSFALTARGQSVLESLERSGISD